MARPLRIELENGLYHVTSRDWERREIVRDDLDRASWLDCETVLADIGRNVKHARAAYRRFVERGTQERSPRD